MYQYQKKYNLHKIRWVTIRSSTIIAFKSRNSTRTHKQLYTLMIKKEKQLFNKYTWRLVIPFCMEGNVFMFFSVAVEKREVKIVKMSIYIFWYEKYVYEYKFVYVCLYVYEYDGDVWMVLLPSPLCIVGVSVIYPNTSQNEKWIFACKIML